MGSADTLEHMRYRTGSKSISGRDKHMDWDINRDMDRYTDMDMDHICVRVKVHVLFCVNFAMLISTDNFEQPISVVNGQISTLYTVIFLGGISNFQCFFITRKIK
jgi:hypothetical protein